MTFSLEAHQEEFARSLLWQGDAVPGDVRVSRAGGTTRRFNVYRNNVFTSLTGCLAARYSVVSRLVGAEFFGAMARHFIERSPPTSPALFEYGEEFASFLETFDPVAELDYLPDVARLEWRVATAYHASDAQPAEAGALASLGTSAPDASLGLHPSCALLISDHPIVSLWHTNTHDNKVRPVDLGRPEGALVVRPRFDVAVVPLDFPTYAFVAALKAGHALEASAEIAGELDRQFDLAAALALVFHVGAVAEIRAPAQSDPIFNPHHGSQVSCAI